MEARGRLVASTVWKGQLTFGLVSIPIKLIRAARPERVNLRQLRRTTAAPEREAESNEPDYPSRVPLRAGAPEPEREFVEPVHHAPANPAEIVKGYEAAPDRWVLLEREEIKRMAAKTTEDMQVREFVRFRDIDPVYLENSYYVWPEKVGEKAYAVLYSAMRDTDYAGIAEMAMHGRDHVVILRAGGTGLIAHTMFFENEVRQSEEYRADTSLPAKRESDLAKAFVESLASAFEPAKYKDTYKERVEALIAAKIEGREFAEGPAERPAPPPVIDIADALQRSLDLKRKPPARAAEAQSKPKTKTATRKSGAR
jgi:DNA end-binding protein Ku